MPGLSKQKKGLITSRLGIIKPNNNSITTSNSNVLPSISSSHIGDTVIISHSIDLMVERSASDGSNDSRNSSNKSSAVCMRFVSKAPNACA